MAVVRKLPCRVAELRPHGDHVYTIELAAESAVPRFRPGQFLHLALDEYDPGSFWPESRVFSIASAPDDRDRLRLSYSVRGRFTARMERELAPGNRVWVKLPYGDFVVDPCRPAVLFAGGTGITAFVTFVTAPPPENAAPVVLAYGARRPELLIYRDVLEKAAAGGRVRLHLYSEEPAAGATTGRVSAAAVDAAALAGALCYVSGPPAMIKVLTQELAGRGVSADAIRVDAWE